MISLSKPVILKFFVLALLHLLFLPGASIAQEMPPKPVSLYFNQNLSFGAFSPGSSGGTVTVNSNGVRFATGTVILVSQGYLFFPAIFELEGNPGTITHFLAGPDATLTGSGGGTMTLHLGDVTPADPIIINVAPPGRIQIRIGGTLTVGGQAANPPGFYNGYFTIMIIQE